MLRNITYGPTILRWLKSPLFIGHIFDVGQEPLRICFQQIDDKLPFLRRKRLCYRLMYDERKNNNENMFDKICFDSS